MTVEQFDPQTPKKSSNSAESQTTTLDIPSKMIEEQYQRAISILNKHKDKLTELATVLLDKEVIFKDNLQKIFGDRPYSKLETSPIKDASNDLGTEIIEDDKSESILKETKE